jgi:hypothetical protein
MDGWGAALVMHADRWEAGAALKQASNPVAWETPTQSRPLACKYPANRAAVEAFREAAAKAKKEQTPGEL